MREIIYEIARLYLAVGIWLVAILAVIAKRGVPPGSSAGILGLAFMLGFAVWVLTLSL